MDDDIDIEEHDVLDNPRIKNMFPDLSRVKIEVPDDDHIEEYNSEEIPKGGPQIQLVYQCDYNSVTETDYTGNELSEYDNTGNELSEYDNTGNELSEYDNTGNELSEYDNTGNELSEYDNTGNELSEYDNTGNELSEYNNTGNELSEYNNTGNSLTEYDNTANHDETTEKEPQYEVIDSSQSITDHSETADSHISTQDDMFVDSAFCQIDIQSEYIPNKIIVGSRPSNKVLFDYDALYEEALNSQAMVYLDNWGEKLNTSPCYCKTCKTLFSTINALDAHKMVSHSYLIAVNNNTARKSTASTHIIPPTRNIATKSTTYAGRLCNHCNNIFRDDTTLIKHLYELLPMNNFSNDNQSTVAKNNPKTTAKIPVPETIFTNKKMVDKKLIKNVGAANNINSDVTVKKINIKSHPKSVAISKAKVVSTKIKKINTKSVAVAKPIITSSKVAAEAAKRYVDHRQPYYKCTLCHAILDTKNNAQRHRQIQHPTYKKVHIYHKFYKTEMKLKVRLKGKIDASYIPKSVLFQCGKCQIHLLSPYRALQHFIQCSKVYASHSCTDCHRNIIQKDKKQHYMQHENSNEDFKVYTVKNKHLYERCLCECPKCGVCFEEIPFWSHIKSCNMADFVYCRICDKNIGKIRYRKHEVKHRIRKFTKKDFIFLQYFHNKSFVAKTVNESSKKIIAVNTNTKSDRKIIFYCPYCKCCQTRQTLRGHIDKLCINWKKGTKTVCDKCGLTFSQKPYAAHRTLHDGDNFNMSDYEFVNIITAAKIDPPINSIRECKVCKSNFIRRTPRTRHNCSEDFKYCNICDKKFTLNAYEIHKEGHSDVEIMPELLLKYNSLFSTWNLMYKCTECDIVCLSYDIAVEHSQKHIIYATDTSIYCKICHLTVHDTHYSIHADLHETNSSLTVDSFKILKYDYKKLFNNDWMDFSDLTDQDINVILSKSVYKHVRNVKMNVTGDSDAAKYYCCNCKMSIDDVEIHLNGNCKDTDKYRCKYCKIKMDDLNDLVTHELRHENTRNEFKIVTFNDNKDRKLNAKLKRYSSKSKLSLSKDSKNTEKEKKFKLYCCRKCKVCVRKQNMRGHRCVSDSTKTHFCKLCNQYFFYKYKNNHKKAHLKFASLCKQTLSIIYFNDNNYKSETSDVQDITDPGPSKIFKIVKLKGEKDTKLKIKLKKQTSKMEHLTENGKRYRVYCCKSCNICVTLKQNMNMHRCSIKKYYCPHCDHYFSFNFRANHERAHLNFPNLCKKTLAITYFGDDKTTEKNKDTPNDISKNTVNDNDKYIMYQCECNIHYGSIKSIKKHTKICNLANIVIEKCFECGLCFSAKDFSRHLCIKNKEVVIKNVIKTNWYQCSNCEILFLTENEVRQHYDTCNPKFGIKCNKCNYKYLRNCINSHRCCENDTSLYISTVTRIKQELKHFTVYSCTKCDINYWSTRSYDKHVTRYHSVRRQKVFCHICKLYFTKVSHERHSNVHKDAMEYKIKVINPVTNQYKILRGKNAANNKKKNKTDTRVIRGRDINESDKDSINITRSRKRKVDSGVIEEINTIGLEVGIGNKKSKGTVGTLSINTLSDTATEIEGDSTLNNEGDENSIFNSALSEGNSIASTPKNRLHIRNENTLYKCPKCPMYYLNFESMKYHVSTHANNKPKEHFECPICHLNFSSQILPKHNLSQHVKKKFNLEDFEIREVKIENGICKVIEKQIKSIDAIAGNINDGNTEAESQDEVGGSISADVINDSSDDVDGSSVTGVFDNSNTEVETSVDGVIDGDSQDSNIEKNESTEASTIDDGTVAIDNLKKEIRLFKCGHCNVCFITKDECLQHVDKHDTIDSKYYISCKICNFQYMISSLKLHMEKHHENEFRLEDIIIEEYTVVGDDLDTKIDVYYAVDRVQSRLISTTTDEGKDDM